MAEYELSWTDSRDNTWVLTVDGYHTPGRCSGPPESCYPDEGELILIRAVCEDGQAGFEDGDKLTADEFEAYINKIGDDSASFWDGLYDDMREAAEDAEISAREAAAEHRAELAREDGW